MAILKNKTQKNFTMISNNILRDSKLRMIDRGTLCTICSLPDGWDFSVAGLCAIVPDGKSALSNSLNRLEKIGYLKRNTVHGKHGKFETEIEVFLEKEDESPPLPIIGDGKTVADNPSRNNGDGKTVTVNQPQYNTDNIKLSIKKDNVKSINQSVAPETDRGTDDAYRELIAENIKLDWLLQAASQKNEYEVRMVHEIYDVICDMVCYPRDKVEIKGTVYPWEAVKSQFLKLGYDHVAAILNRVVDANLGIKNMQAYLISSLYSESLTGTLETEAGLYDDYLKFLRGKPY
ncbi:hypothetical protein SAMN05216391_102142 [Lachnospiraceae bacterium KHCPX20]|nr:hypothetical protein SAMN05216391_102142 [Lachnospiraceae bacterium KHCPX20]